MRIAVTGCEGQLALGLVERSHRRSGMEVVTIGRPHLDLTEPATILPAIERCRPDLVVSAAAYTAVDQAESEPEAAFAVNAFGAGAVAEAAACLEVPIVHISTDYVFDGSKPRSYAEGDTPAPLSVYGASKLAGESAVAEATPRHLILRTGWVYSPFGRISSRPSCGSQRSAKISPSLRINGEIRHRRSTLRTRSSIFPRGSRNPVRTPLLASTTSLARAS